MKKIMWLFFAIALLMTSCARPVANFTIADKSAKTVPADIRFENKSKKAAIYEWDFGDGKTSSELSPSHQYYKPGKYTITLKAITQKGKTSTHSKQIQIDAPEECLVEMETSMGTMVILLSSATPGHRDNFIKLAEQGFYDGLLFHRVINGFMIQGGDPNSRNAKPNARLGSGGPGYQIPAEFVDSLVHIKGAICAARTNNPEKKSSGSQFYIVQGTTYSDAQIDQMEKRKGFKYTAKQRELLKTVGGTPQLDREYVVYGHVISGLDVIDKIAQTPTKAGDRPIKDVVIKKVRVIK
ncbi:MAG TPA: PKD domain-containing protein [Phaeodactylibacter sp.]|nr:PKD domain-containing protein [Phaeodactylibacter sp.]